jgi:hypothetical protein
MSNSIATKTNAAYVAGAAEANFPLGMLASREIEREFGNDQGDTVNMKMAGYGVVTQGEAIGNTDVIVEVVPIQVLPYNTAAALGIVEESLKIGDFKEAVATPRGVNIADTFNQIAMNQALGAANTSVISTGTFAQLGQAVARVKTSKMKGPISGYLGHDLTSLITNSGISQFGNSTLASKLYEGVLGSYRGANWVEGPTDVLVIAQATIAAGGGANLVTAADGATALTFAGVQTLSKGVVINLAGVNAVDELGKDTGTLRSFVVASDVAANATVPIVGAIHFTGPKKNVSVGAIAGVVATTPMTAGSYLTGICFNKLDLCMAMKPIAPFPGAESVSLQTVKGIPLRMTAQGNVSTGARVTRWDVLYGVKARSGRGTCGIYVKL